MLNQQVKEAISSHSKDLGDKVDVSKLGNSISELNSYYRNLLIQAPINTLNERGCLLDDLDEATWLNYFKDQVVPTLVRFELV